MLGGIAGWFIGHYAYDAIARPILEFYGKYDEFEQLRTSSGVGLHLLMLITSGAAHLPPIKVVTILSGVIGVNLALFIVLGDRGARRPLPAAGLAVAPLWRADPRVHRKAPWPDRRRRQRLP